ncbi:MAG: FAD-dependent oxidoreductase [Candidatus Limnocylindrales bacterium]
MRQAATRRHDVVVIGGGQNGLAAGYHLARAGIDHVILERAPTVGDVWRSRYDSLTLYSPARFDALPGLPFPLEPMDFPTGRQMADYLETYAEHLGLPVLTGVEVEGLRPRREDRGYEVTTSAGVVEAVSVILATGPYQRPAVPAFAEELDAGIGQVHSADYRNPDQIAAGPVLVVGASHSGSDLAFELVRTHRTYLAGRSHGQFPISVDSRLGRVLWPLFRATFTKVLTLDTPIGRKMAPMVRAHGAPLLRHRWNDLRQAGVESIPERVLGVEDGKPKLESGRVLDVASVVWCTGFEADYSWIEPSIVGEDGWPTQQRGVVTGAPGLYVLGTPFLHSFASMLVTGAGVDARHVVDHIRASRTASVAMPAVA